MNSEYSEYWPSLSVDEQMLMFTVMLPLEPNEGRDHPVLNEDFYYSVKTGDKWGDRINAGPLLNTPDNEGAHTMTADGRVMYFTACNRRDGKGQCDIYQSVWRDGKWNQPWNLGSPVNTVGDEMFPYVSEEGDLYFASNGHIGLGGLDIFKLTEDDNGRPLIVNMKPPINSPSDDFGIVFDGKNERGYFSSTRPGGRGNDDIYSFELPALVFTLKGTVRNVNLFIMK